jgi:hypothetical protein
MSKNFESTFKTIHPRLRRCHSFEQFTTEDLMYYRIHEKLGQQNVVVMSTFQKCCSVTFLRTLF